MAGLSHQEGQFVQFMCEKCAFAGETSSAASATRASATRTTLKNHEQFHTGEKPPCCCSKVI